MKNTKMRSVLLSVCALAAAGFSATGSAHSVTGSLSSTSANNIDVYHTTCFSWGNGTYANAPAGEVNGAAARFVAQVQRTSGSGTVKVSVGKINLAGNGVSASSTGALSGWANSANGNGDYVFAVSHSSAVANNYTVNFHCEAAGGSPGSGSHTGTGVNFTGTAPNVTPSADDNLIINQ